MFYTLPTSYYLAIFIPFGLSWLVNRLLVPKPLPGIPQNRFARFMPLGDFVSLGIHYLLTGSVFDWFSKQCLKHKSPLIQVLVPSFSITSPTLLLADLCEIKDIAVRRVHEIDRATLLKYCFEVAVPYATSGMQSTDAFKHQRRLWNCILSPEFLENVATPAFDANIRRLIDLWTLKAKIADGSSFAAPGDLRRTTLEGMWKMILGTELGLTEASICRLQEDTDAETSDTPSPSLPHFFRDFRLLHTGIVWVVTGISPAIYKWVCNVLPIFRNAKKRTKKLFQNFVDDTRQHIIEGKPTRRCGLSEALQTNDTTVSDAALTDEILELLFTGHETTASAAGWALKYLADHQEAQQRLYNALKHAFPEATSSDLPLGLDITQAEIPYLDALLAEILRLACTGPIIFRETVTDCEIMGYHIPAKTPIFMIIQSPADYMITPDTFEAKNGIVSEKNAGVTQSLGDDGTWGCHLEEFRPERWLNSDGKFDANAGLSLPFSTGKRGCFGRRIAMLELKLLISLLVLGFHFVKLPNGRSKYNSNDALSRQPRCCYVKPNPRQG